MTIREAVESYLFYQAKVRMRSPSTIKGRRIYLTRFGNYFGMDADIGSLSNIDIDRFGQHEHQIGQSSTEPLHQLSR